MWSLTVADPRGRGNGVAKRWHQWIYIWLKLLNNKKYNWCSIFDGGHDDSEKDTNESDVMRAAACW